MIDTDHEDREAPARVKEAETRITEQGARLRHAGLAEDEIKRVLDPLKSFYLGLKEEVEAYERRRSSPRIVPRFTAIAVNWYQRTA